MHFRRCAIGMATHKWRVRIVFQAKLNSLSHGLTSDLGGNAETEIYSRRDASRGDDVSILDHTTFLMRRTDEGKQFRKRPMGDGPSRDLLRLSQPLATFRR